MTRPPDRSGSAARAAASVVLAAVMAGGCAPGSASHPPSGETRVQPPEGFGALVTQFTHDVPGKRIAVRVSNSSSRELRVESLEVRAPGFDGPGVVDTATTVPPGRAFDIRSPFGEPDCDAPAPPDGLRVAFTFADRDGTAVVTPVEGGELLARIHDETCAAEAAQEVAPMAWTSGWEVRGAGDDLVAVATLRIGPVAEGEQVSLAGTLPTVIFQLEPRGAPEAMTGRDTAEIEVVARPTRCDPHVIADNGAGWVFLFRMMLLTRDQEALVPLPPDDAARTQLEDYWLARCGFAE